MLKPLDEGVLETIRDLTRAASELGLSPVLIGGIAVGLVAKERATRDVDALVVFDTAEAETLLSALERFGFKPRFAAMAEFGRQARFMSLQHTSGVALDLALGCMPFEGEIVSRAVPYTRGGISMCLPTPEDLIILKAIAHRPQDLVDIQTIAEIRPNLDRKRIKHWVTEYADLLEEPNLWNEIEPLLEPQ